MVAFKLMNRRLTARLTRALFAGLFVLAVLTPLTALGQNANQNPSSSGQGFMISPVLVELNADPGKTYTINIKLKNITANTLVSKSQVNNFGAKGENGDPEIYLDDNEKISYALKGWVVKIPDYTFATQETKTIPVSIAVPPNAEPGGHYGVIRFTGVPPELADDQSRVALSASIGTLVLVRVSGEIKESAKIEEFYAAQYGKKSGFFEQGPLGLTERVKNNGNVHVKPVGTVEVKDMFGRTTASLKVNDDNKNILPSTIRRFDQELNKKWLFGRYTANLALTYGSTNQKLTSQIVFWVIPWKLILAILLLIIAIILVFRSGLKRYNKHIVEKAKNIQ